MVYQSNAWTDLRTLIALAFTGFDKKPDVGDFKSVRKSANVILEHSQDYDLWFLVVYCILYTHIDVGVKGNYWMF